jgi:hypothetical protein
MENALIVILIALVAYGIYDQQQQKQPRKKRARKEKEYIPYPVSVRDYGPGVPPPPYRPYNNSTVFSQVGILTDPAGGVSDILPLFGRLAPGCSTRYQYYTRTSGYQAVQIEVHYGGRDCMDGYCSSCDEIYDGTTGITVDGYTGVNFTASIYQIP